MAMRKYLVLSVLGACLLVLAPAAAAFAGNTTTPTSPTATPTPTPTATPTATPTPTPTSTPPPAPTIYAGKNSQGQKLRFAVVRTASGPKFDPIFTVMTVRCPITSDLITIGFGFSGFRIPIKNGKFSLVLNDLSERFLWSGTVTSTKASGPESFAMPAFDHEGGLQNCTSGPLSWTAKAVAPGSSAAAAPSSGYVIKFTKASDGSVHLAVAH